MRNVLNLTILVCFCSSIFANTYRVQIAVYENSVATDYFYNLDKVKLAVDVNDLYRYYLGDFSDLATAEATKKEVLSKGYKYAKIVDLTKEKASCAMSCEAPLYVENIFFDFDRSNLRIKSRRDLDDLATLMQDNPDYKIELSAHTDAKGSLEYNTKLSHRRATSAKDYLISRGISTARITTSEFGETDPIAKNELNGSDSPEGRQYNRRVVVSVMNGNGTIVPNVVKPIEVPPVLQTK